ncbi:MAG: thioredoxin domain-containing protein [Planctomycetota bacterium]
MSVQPKHTNQLIHEASPYLLQHAHNPVDWHPWGNEAFTKAKKDNKPIFLSIGYSTCHWCHVMAHESFENERIAAILNEHFISIKVDREELPGVDAVYMDFVQKTTGSGGWPMSVFLTPDAKPFYGGTYFPPVDSYGRPGFETLLTSIEEAWRNRQDEILRSSEQLTQALQEKVQTQSELALTEDALTTTSEALEQIYDSQYGGFGNAPKFPQPSMLSLLLIYSHRTENENALSMVEKTLEKMASGGIYDHLGGGFHRYSVDQKWLVPHFEKMLYDQALISRAYIQAFQITQKSAYQQIAEEVFKYVLRDMTSPQGGFYSAEDADSEGHEGVFYVWNPKQVDKILSRKEQELVKAYYGISDTGNFERGTSILNVTSTLDEVAKEIDIDPHDTKKILESAEQKLFQAREKRIRPHRDEKIIAGWNGLMISSLAYGGAVFNEPRYVQAAQRSANFVMDNLDKSGRLKRYYAQGKAHEYAVLDDYAYLIRGLIDLYQADFDPKWLGHAVKLADQMTALFEDEKNGGFYLTGSDTQNLIRRTRPDYDGATPSGNSVATAELIRLFELTGNRDYFLTAQKTLRLFQEDLKRRGTSLTELLAATDLWLGARTQIVIAGKLQADPTQKILKSLRGHFLPRTVLLVRDPETNAQELDRVAAIVKAHDPIEGKVTVYLCEDFVCKSPVTEYDAFLKSIKELQ